MRIEVCLASEDLGGNLVLLRRYTGMLKGVVRQVLEQLAEGFRAMEGTATDKLLELRELLGAIAHSIPTGGGVKAL